MSHPLDNPVWSALTGPHATLAIGGGAARHYPRDMAPFSAVAEASAVAYADLARDLAPGIEARLFRPLPELPPPGWEVISARPILQMTAPEAEAFGPEPDADVVLLGPADIGDMCALAEIARPGPFGPRTPMLGTYIGIRREKRLLAMAGERMKLDRFAEISAVCTHPEARGRGFAARLTWLLAQQILARGETPFLHVFPDNRAALSVYERLGFRARTQLFVLWHRAGRLAEKPDVGDGRRGLSGGGRAALPARG